MSCPPALDLAAAKVPHLVLLNPQSFIHNLSFITMANPKSVLFVCVENSNRSQMAEAFAKIYGQDLIEANSSGSRPSGRVNPKAIEAMRELGYDLSVHHSKGLDAFNGTQVDVAVTMGCGDECPMVLAKERLDWKIPDPRDMSPEEFRAVRDLIGSKVKSLVEGLLADA